MLGEWYLPPGECQVIWTITEGTVSISHHAIHPLPTRIPQTPFPQADKPNNPRPTPVPRSGGLRLVAEFLLDNQMLQDIAKKNNDSKDG